jgi:hypothetical protein
MIRFTSSHRDARLMRGTESSNPSAHSRNAALILFVDRREKKYVGSIFRYH